MAELCRSANSPSYDWEFFIADRQAACKQIPLDPSETRLAIIGIRNPRGNWRYGFYIRSLLFGAASSALRYNIFFADPEGCAHLFWDTALIYFGDFGAIIPLL